MNDIQFKTSYLAETHEVQNQPQPLQDYNVYLQDLALREAVAREDGAWAEGELQGFGVLAGSQEMIELGFQANENKPVLHTHDRYGRRVDEVRFHPAYHRLMQVSIEHGLHSSHWTHPRPGAQVARAAKFYMQSQVEAAHCCPITMTSAAIPALRLQPDVAAQWEPKILARHYDHRNVPTNDKMGVTIGMAMTEKQGGSDVRANTTRAYPLGAQGPGQAYELVGHKYFVSAPMCDAFLVLAQAPGGLSCFLLPRWRPDGSKNALQIQRLKNKMGNVANASSETELRGAWAVMVGEEGRGVATILKMVSMTRFDCMIGSSGGMRQAAVQALHHCAHRSAFGKLLSQQPLMQNVLADLVIETEAALAMTMRVAGALDRSVDSQSERLLVRVGTAVGKYWICKRTPGHAYEAMECIGGSGVMEDSIMPRLLRESPVNSIWEGSGNVQCLDMLRAMGKSPESVDAFMAEVSRAAGADKRLDQYIAQMQAEFADLADIEYRARRVVEKMALALQGSLLVRHGDPAVADAFCASRLSGGSTGFVYGGLPRGVDCGAIIRRALPMAA
ncbi:MAG TPA: acyl-CoA dehydrogenase family protein [Noviherbaspirillum sp.]|uniref:acyl-CoA dehydrogenase family protein n=1 Tax=Noviherbaspirillum sp. TaxID=1926288 RepID=UPI002B49FC6B|nr:acyl-CoA dehydrogenase family protein [Noviherbaspirillum sp.]HJV86372.1 acyl-CoA dehydrogenase family protein [Noviherbaspirillum sp.]